MKNRHGCLSLWMMLMAAGNIMSLVMYAASGEAARALSRAGMGSLVWADAAFSLFNLICLAALYRWRKWGFWGLCVSTVSVLAMNAAAGINWRLLLIGPLGALILFAALQAGRDNKGWTQLR